MKGASSTDDTTTWRRSKVRDLGVLLALMVVYAVSVTVADDHGQRSRRSAVAPGDVREGPPIKPEYFRSTEELRKFLADLNEYYAIASRPRSVRSVFTSRAQLILLIRLSSFQRHASIIKNRLHIRLLFHSSVHLLTYNSLLRVIGYLGTS